MDLLPSKIRKMQIE